MIKRFARKCIKCYLYMATQPDGGYEGIKLLGG